ncbi:MAG: DUF222 domain-containing protein [Nocardioides sp.]
MNSHTHPVLAAVAAVEAAVKNVADVNPGFMSTDEEAEALRLLTTVTGRLDELRLRVLASASDVAEQTGARDVAAWLAAAARLDGSDTRRDERLATALDERWHAVAAGLREGAVNTAQATVIVRALDDLPDDLVSFEVQALAEARLVELAAEFGPRQLRILGRRVLDVVAPEIAEEVERKALEREDARADRLTFLTTRRNGDGMTDVRIRLADTAADRLLTYLEAFTSPRRTPRPGEAVIDRRPYDQRLGHAFVAFLESTDPQRMPLHGGDATTVIVTLDFATLAGELGTALVGDEVVTAAMARRLACTAHILPAVFGGESEVLDLGRKRRLFSPAQRKALAIRDRRCRTEGCDIPAAWCEAHHAADPWVSGGRTDLADGLLLCSWHHRAHDHRYDQRRLPNGDLRLRRRT